MNTSRRQSSYPLWLLAALAITIALPGCSVHVAHVAKQLAEPDNSAEPPKMSSVEARSTLARARQHLYSSTPPNYGEATRLAESVIDGCESLFCVWEGHEIKAAALQRQGKYREAAAAAQAGIEALLRGDPGPLSPGGLSALKRLAVTYVQNAAAARDGNLVPTLCSWRELLSARCDAGEPDGLATLREIDETFNTLRDLAEESMASRPIESRIRRVVQSYLTAFNRNETEDIMRVIVAGTPFAAALRRKLAAPETPETVRALYLLGPLQITVREGRASATASCDLLVTTAAGWARRAPDVRFVLSQQPSGEWLVLNVAGHP